MDDTLLNNILIYGGGLWAFVMLLMLITKLYLLFLENKIDRLPRGEQSHEREMLRQKHERGKLIYDRIIFVVLGGAFILIFVLIIKMLSDSDDDDSDSGSGSGSWLSFLPDYIDSSSSSSSKKKDKLKKKQKEDDTEGENAQ